MRLVINNLVVQRRDVFFRERLAYPAAADKRQPGRVGASDFPSLPDDRDAVGSNKDVLDVSDAFSLNWISIDVAGPEHFIDAALQLNMRGQRDKAVAVAFAQLHRNFASIGISGNNGRSSIFVRRFRHGIGDFRNREARESRERQNQRIPSFALGERFAVLSRYGINHQSGISSSV